MSITALQHPSHHRSWIEVDLSALGRNVRRFCDLVADGIEVMPCVKADAYGHGAIATSRAAVMAGASRLVVATSQEGEELRAAGIEVPIHILGASLPEEVPRAIEENLTLSIHETEIARLVSLAAVKHQRQVPVHLKIDTGMGRLGILPEDVVAAAREIAHLPGLQLTGAFMHFADAGDEAYSVAQLARFKDACDALEGDGLQLPLCHAANSAAAVLYPDSHFQMIRPGAGIYGYHCPGWLQKRFPVEAVLSWRCVVVQLKDYPPGKSLGYNRTFTTRRPTRVAVLPVGYGDGYLRSFSNRADVLIHGERAPVVGMISMDYAMVDVTDLSGVEVGSHVTLIGQDGEGQISVEELAEHADTIPYCITTGLGRRPGRCYIQDDPS